MLPVLQNLSPSVSELLDLSRPELRSQREINLKMIAFLASQGDDQETISKKLGLEKYQVRALMDADDCIALIVRLQNTMISDPLVRVKRIANMALDVQLRLLLQSKDEKVLAQLSENLLNRAMGKATQVIEQRNLNVNVSDKASLDKAIEAQINRLAKLEETQRKIRAKQVEVEVVQESAA